MSEVDEHSQEDRIAALETMVEKLRKDVEHLERADRRIRQRLATIEHELAKATGQTGLRILSEAEIQARCPCCGRTGT